MHFDRHKIVLRFLYSHFRVFVSHMFARDAWSGYKDIRQLQTRSMATRVCQSFRLQRPPQGDASEIVQTLEAPYVYFEVPDIRRHSGVSEENLEDGVNVNYMRTRWLLFFLMLSHHTIPVFYYCAAGLQFFETSKGLGDHPLTT